MAPGSAVIHLATHGLVLGAKCPSRGRSRLEISGLALADGVLTSEEIAAVDLSRVGFAALSSRESGGGTAAEAAREASLEILRDRRKRGLGTSPIHGGAFVAAGI